MAGCLASNHDLQLLQVRQDEQGMFKGAKVNDQMAAVVKKHFDKQ